MGEPPRVAAAGAVKAGGDPAGTAFDALPGVPLPVAEVTRALGEMWQGEEGSSGGAPSAFRASQMNLILHLGLAAGEEDARAQFETAVRFAQRHPCRIVVLCPHGGTAAGGGGAGAGGGAGGGDDDDAGAGGGPGGGGGGGGTSGPLLQGKLFSQCYLGGSYREMCCCEALLLDYPETAWGFIADQVSVWLEGDLPVYHWFHRVPAARVRERYLGFVESFQRVVYDSSLEPGAFAAEGIGGRENFFDLAAARNLPVRQAVGQFLSGYPPEVLVDGLGRVVIAADAGRWGEAHDLARWQAGCLQACGRRSLGRGADVPEFPVEVEVGGDAPAGLTVEWTYRDGERFFRWAWAGGDSCASAAADFSGGEIAYPERVRALAPERALAEALFF